MVEGVGPAPGDDELLVLARAGDSVAFGAFYAANIDAVIAFFYRRTACPHTAADLAAETFAQALASLRRFKPGKLAARPWLFGIANNLLRTWLRQGRVARRNRRRLGITTPALDHIDVEHIEGLVDLRPLAGELADALVTLSPDLRQALLLRVAHDLSYDEVAAALGCSAGAARQRVSRALAQVELAVGAL